MKTRPIAIVTGISGQTSAYLVKILIREGYSVVGTTRDNSRQYPVNLVKLGVDQSNVQYTSLDPSDPRQVYALLIRVQPDIIFNLAGQTSVALSFLQPAEAIESISISCLNFLEAIRCLEMPIRYFNAGSSECFGNTGKAPVNEESLLRPTSPYSVAKIASVHLTTIARSAYGIYACSGLLSNHESPLRPTYFVTQKIVSKLKEIKASNGGKLFLGNLDIIRDWGWAAEYAEAIFRIATAEVAEDYIVATGESHSLREFVQIVCELLNLDYGDCIVEGKEPARPLELLESRLDPAKIYRELNWRAETKFKHVIEKLVSSELF
jgi:GDPmannose 4,6-dehydratase